MKILILLLSIVALSYSKANDSKCKLGPSYWCKDDLTAKRCGVALFCKAMKTLSDDKLQFHSHLQHEDAQKPKLDAPPVKVGFYYESLCPGCRGVWQQQLFPTFQKLGSTGIVQFDIVPYGNAREYQYGDQWVFTCQHGVNECTG